MTTIYLMSYAFTQGVLKAEADINSAGLATFGRFSAYAHPDKYTLTEEGARWRFEEMRAEKLLSLRKQIAKTEARKFKIKDYK